MYLLDTHTFLWFISDDPKLPTDVKALIETSEDICVSIGTFWEMAIKNSLGKLELPVPITTMMEDCAEFRFSILPIRAAHLEKLNDLPKIHGDPFDRLFICQAMIEGRTIITIDENISKYDVSTRWKSQTKSK